MKQREKLLKELTEKSRKYRRDIVEMVFKAASGHPAGSLSAIDIINALYNHKLNITPKNPKSAGRDRFILSKGHDCPALYAVLADRGFFPKDELNYFRKLGHLLQGHADIKIPGIEMSAGSLGMGISFGIGVAFARKIDNKKYKIWVMIGDGETQEGQVWESAMTANHYKLDIKVIMDKNGIQNDWFVKETKVIDPIEEKWKAFGWKTKRIKGHNFNQILDALDWADNQTSPCIIIADTIKGKGVSFMENNPDFHGKAPNEAEFKQAMKELA